MSWNADAAAGTLAGWGTDDVDMTPPVSSSAAAPAAASSGAGYGGAEATSATVEASLSAAPSSGSAAPRADRAEDLFSDWYGDSSATATDTRGAEQDANELENALLRAAEDDEAGNRESLDHDDVDDLDAQIEKITGDIDDNAERLSALLCDNAAFYEACEAAINSAAGPFSSPADAQIKSVAQLQKALTYICVQCKIDPMDAEDARDLFDGPMQPSVFYGLAKEVFTSLSRTLHMS